MSSYSVGKNTKEKIIRTAKRLFIEQGYYETTCASIAKEADVKLGTLTYHFKSKATLFETVYGDYADKVFSLSKTLLSESKSAINFAICTIIFWHYIYSDESFRKLCMVANDILVSNNHLDIFGHGLKYFDLQLSSEKDYFDFIARIGTEAALIGYIHKYPDFSSYEKVSEYQFNQFASSFSLSTFEITTVFNQAMLIVKNANLEKINIHEL